MPAGPALAAVMGDYVELGVPGAVGSTGVSHVHWANTPSFTRESHVSEENMSTLAFQCTVDHGGRCLGATKGFPCAGNDRGIVKF